MDKSTFVLEASSREEAFTKFIEFESGFQDISNPYLSMTFSEFCQELEKGYGNSDCIQIARLYEDCDGKIWYDNAYVA